MNSEIIKLLENENKTDRRKPFELSTEQINILKNDKNKVQYYELPKNIKFKNVPDIEKTYANLIVNVEDRNFIDCTLYLFGNDNRPKRKNKKNNFIRKLNSSHVTNMNDIKDIKDISKNATLYGFDKSNDGRQYKIKNYEMLKEAENLCYICKVLVNKYDKNKVDKFCDMLSNVEIDYEVVNELKEAINFKNCKQVFFEDLLYNKNIDEPLNYSDLMNYFRCNRNMENTYGYSYYSYNKRSKEDMFFEKIKCNRNVDYENTYYENGDFSYAYEKYNIDSNILETSLSVEEEKEFEQVILDDMKRNKYFCRFIGKPLKEYVRSLLYNSKVEKFVPYVTNVTEDVDFDNDELGTIKFSYLIKSLIDSKVYFFIIKNKDCLNDKKKNHFTIVFPFSRWMTLDEAIEFRNKFKIAGICDPGHSTFYGKNIYNSDKFYTFSNIYEACYDNCNCKTIDKLNRLPLVDNCIDIYKEVFKSIKLNNPSDIWDAINKSKNQRKAILDKDIDFTNTLDFRNYLEQFIENEEKETNDLELIIESNKVKDINDKKIDLYSTNYSKLIHAMLDDKTINSLDDLYEFVKVNGKIKFFKDYRLRNIKGFGSLLGGCYKLGWTNQKDVLNIYDNIIEVDNNDKKYKEAFFNAYCERRNKEDFTTYNKDKALGYCGNIISNGYKTVDVMNNIIEKIIDAKDKLIDKKLICRQLIKERKTYRSFINNVANIMYGYQNSNNACSKILFLMKVYYESTTTKVLKHSKDSMLCEVARNNKVNKVEDKLYKSFNLLKNRIINCIEDKDRKEQIEKLLEKCRTKKTKAYNDVIVNKVKRIDKVMTVNKITDVVFNNKKLIAFTP